LPLSLEAVDKPQGNLKEDALLDTGATACAISIDVALKLHLRIKDPEETEEKAVRTAALNQDLPVRGKVQLSLRWKDEHGMRFGTKIWVYVVYGLAHSVLLSHDFTHHHPEVWSIAKAVAHVGEQLNLLWFNKLSKEQQEAEDEYRKKRLEENTARANAEKQERLAKVERRLGDFALSPTAGSSTASTSGSTSGSTNG
jgi:hypothetical protein